MSSRTSLLRKIVSTMLVGILTAQPAFASVTQYRIPLRGLTVTEPPVNPADGTTPSGGGVTTPIPNLSVSPGNLTFPATRVGVSAVDQAVTLTNEGPDVAVLDGIGITQSTSQFGQSNNCGTNLPADTACTITVRYTPTSAMTNTGELGVSSNGTPVARVSLSGRGIESKLSLSTSQIAFPATAVGSTASPMGIIITNPLDVPVTFSSMGIVTGGTEFAQADTCDTLLAAGASCTVSIQWTPTSTSTDSGTWTAVSSMGSYSVALSGQHTAVPALTFDPSPTGNFGSVGTGSTISRTYFIKNTGQSTDTLAATPAVSGTGFSVTGGTCAKGLSMAPNTYCTSVVTVSTTTVGPLADTLSITSSLGANAQLPLQASVVQSTYAVSGTANAASAPVTDFGQPTTNLSVVNYYYVRDNTNTANVSTSQVALTGDSSFKVIGIASTTNGSNPSVVAACTSSSTGSSTACNTGALSRVVRVAVQFTPTTVGVKTANLHLEYNGAPYSTDIAISGTGMFNASGAWSISPSNTAAPTAADLSYGTQSTGSTTAKVFVMRNTGTNGGQSTGFVLSGDTSHFKISAVNRVWSSSVTTCLSGGVVATNGLSSTDCLANDPSTSTNYTAVGATVQFIPGAVGNYSVTLTPTSSNGMVLPGAITLTGTGQFNPTGTWANNATTTAPSTADLAFGTKTTASATTKTFNVRNTGTNGALAVGFALSGDTSQYKITSVMAAAGNSTIACVSGGVIATGGASATPCLVTDKASTANGTLFTTVSVTVQFQPTAVGSSSVTVTPTTNNGTALPSPIILTGSGQFNPAGAWTTGASTAVAPTASDLAFGTKAVGSSVSKLMYVRNTGTNGGQATGFTVTGDITQFQLVTVATAVSTSTSSCLSGGVVAANYASATPCLATDISQGAGYFTSVRITVQFYPKAAGNFSITVTPTSNNGTIMPGAITFTGTGQ